LPRNVTRKVNIPHADQYALVGVAPWMPDHPECALSYIRATTADPSHGLVFFPTRANAAIATPVGDNPDWGVNATTWDSWVAGTDYSIWGIPADIGATLVEEMGRYSGNVTVAPFGSELAQIYPPEDAVRLLARVTLTSQNTNPVLGRLWVFAILILAILCVVTGLTSLFMHVNQRRMGRDLRRRIANGEVDLEVLGIKRQKVPQKLLDEMPLYVYTSKIAPVTTPEERGTDAQIQKPTQSFSALQRKNLPKRDVPFSQTTCPICLDDFEHNDTIVRELPCQHIFHPECVDEFLRTNSSLCPMCKKSALPTGYCPENITVAMVRRERSIRRLRELGTDSPTLAMLLPASVQRFLPDWLLRARARPRQGAERPYSGWAYVREDGQIVSPPPPLVNRQRLPLTTPIAQPSTTSPTPQAPFPPSTTTTNDLELGILNPIPTSHPSSPDLQPQPQPVLEDLPPEIQALSPEERREWGRQRLAAALPPTQVSAEEEISPNRVGRVRRAWRKMFPS
jgi:Ring finger domain